MAKIRYTLVGGTLPEGMSLQKNTGILSGTVTPGSLGVGPKWPTNLVAELGTYSDNDAVSLPGWAVQSDTALTFGVGVVNERGRYRGLPFGLVMNPDTGAITGNVSKLLNILEPTFSSNQAPVWNTDDYLGFHDDTVDLSVQLSATAETGHSVVGYSVVRGMLPAGATINYATGQLTATKQSLQGVRVPWADRARAVPSPRWTTPLGLLASVDDTAPLNIALAASGETALQYRVVNGRLPTGATLNSSTGVISASQQDIQLGARVAWDLADKATNTFTWATPAGNIGQVDSNKSITTGVSASVPSGTLVYRVVGGLLPLGTQMNATTGAITGTAVFDYRVSGGAVIGNPPSAAQLSEATGFVPTSATALGSIPAGTAISFKLSAVAQGTRTISNIYVNTRLPWGLSFNPTTGVVSGTPRGIPADVPVLPYSRSFRVTAVDSDGATSNQTFTVTITQ